MPQIAKAQRVCRQHIQFLVDRLVEKGIVEMQDNPGHKRSKHVALTEFGRKQFEGIRGQEAETMAQLSSQLETTLLDDATRALRELRRVISKA